MWDLSQLFSSFISDILKWQPRLKKVWRVFVAPPAQALAALGAEEEGLPAWLKDSGILLLVLLTLAVRLDHRPERALMEAVPIALFGHWGSLSLTPLVRALADTSAAWADTMTLSVIVVGLCVVSRIRLG